MFNEEALANFRRYNDDTEGNYRYFLKLLISRKKENAGGEKDKQFLDDCQMTAERVFPKGTSAARKTDWASEGILAALFTAL